MGYMGEPQTEGYTMTKYRVFASYDAGFYVDIVANSSTDAEAEMMELINNNDIPENAVIINRDYFITASEDSGGTNGSRV